MRINPDLAENSTLNGPKTLTEELKLKMLEEREIVQWWRHRAMLFEHFNCSGNTLPTDGTSWNEKVRQLPLKQLSLPVVLSCPDGIPHRCSETSNPVLGSPWELLLRFGCPEKTSLQPRNCPSVTTDSCSFILGDSAKSGLLQGPCGSERCSSRAGRDRMFLCGVI